MTQLCNCYQSSRAAHAALGTISRRQLIVGSIGLGVLFATGCSSDSSNSSDAPNGTATPNGTGTSIASESTDDAPTTETEPSTGPTTPATSAEVATTTAAPAGSFPVTITHAFGDTTLTTEPERIVLVGFKEQDYFLALGVVPVAIREWFGGQPNAVWPWATSYLGDAEPVVLARAELNYEEIAELAPDVIVGLSSGMTGEQYDLLAQIAPTVAQLSGEGDYTATWQEMTRTAGQIVGRTSEADRIVAELEKRIADTREAHPELVGASTILASAVGGEYYLYGPGATASLVLAELGLTMSAEVAALTDNDNAYYLVTPERFDLFDVDVAVWSEAATDEGPQALLASPIYGLLDVHTQGRDVFLGDLNGAMVFASVLSLPLVLDEIVPQLALAVDGDPSTLSTLGAS